jgi:hypothetical protein
MERPLVRAADIHSGTAADRLEPFEHFDRMGVVIGRGGSVGREQIGHDAGYRAAWRRVAITLRRRGGGPDVGVGPPPPAGTRSAGAV